MTIPVMDYKATLHLPKTDFPMKANLAQAEPRMLAWWDEIGHLQAAARVRGRPSAVDPARRPAVRQRQHPHGPRPQQGPQGRGREVALDARLQRRLRPGLGLPRPAHRAPGRQGARSRHRVGRRAPGHGPRREAAPLPRVREQVRRHPAPGVSAAGRVRRLGQPVPHDGARLSGGDRARVRALRRPRHRLQGSQARALVHALQDRAGPGRGGVRGAAHAVGLREVPARHGAGAGRRARRASGLRHHLDDHALDAAGEPGHRGASRAELHRARRRR